jgi:Bacterial membrane protein YfhO
LPATSDASASVRRTFVLSLAGLVGVLALAYLRVLFLGDTFAVRDHLTWTLPSRAFLGESLRHGHLPEWWDALRLGERFAADPNNGVTYPIAWIVALIDPLLAADLLLLFHILLAGMGLWLLARRLGASALAAFLGAAALMTSGYMTSMIVNGSILMSLGWMPLVAWAALGVAEIEQRRDAVAQGLLFAAVLAGSVASGNPAHVNNIVLAAAIVLLCARHRWRALLTLLAAGALGVLMGAASLLAPLATLHDSTRSGGLALAESGAWSMHPLRLIELVWPQFLGQGLRPERSLAGLWAHGGGTLEPIWSGSNYVGLPVLFCAALAGVRGGRVARRLAILSLFFLVLALGTFTPIYRGYRSIFWFERVLRYPEKHLASAVVLWSVLAALGFDRLFDPAVRRHIVRTSAALALLLTFAVALGYAGQAKLQTAIAQQSLARGIGIDAAGALGAALDGGLAAAVVALCVPLALWLVDRSRFGRFARPGLLLVVLAQLIGHDWSVHVLVPRQLIRSEPGILLGLDRSAESEPPRILRRAQDEVPVSVSGELRAIYLHQLAQQNEAARFGFAQLPGYSIAGTPRFDALAKASGRANLERIMDLLDIRYLIIGAAEAPGMGMPVRAGVFAGHVVLENLERRARAFVAYRFEHGLADEQVLDQLFVPDRAAVDWGAVRLAGEGSSDLQASEEPSRCRVERPLPEHVVLHCSARRPGYAVLLDEWTQGWRATVDDRPMAIERADTVFRAVAIPQGDHVVDMTYQTPGLREGAQVAGAGWLVFLALFSLAMARRRRQRRV